MKAVVGALLCFAAVALLAGSARGQLKNGDPVVTVVNYAYVNARSEPRISPQTFVMRVPRGTQMKRLGKKGDWYHVVLPDGRKGWIIAKYAKEGVARDLLEVRPTRVNVRASPSVGSKAVGTVKQGDLLPMIQKQNDWYQAYLPNGKQGWIRSDMVVRMPVSPPEAAAQPAKPAAKADSAAAPQVDYYQKGLDDVAGQHPDQAIEAFQKAVQAHPNDGAAHFELAKLLEKKGKKKEALTHFQLALHGTRPRPEAQFYIDALLKAPSDTVSHARAGKTPPPKKSRVSWMDRLLAGTTPYLFPALGLALAAFLGGLWLVYRRRRAVGKGQPVYRRRNPDAGFEAVLKYAVEKRPLHRAIEEAERKRLEMDDALQERFAAFQQEGGPKLPSVASSEALLKRVEALRQTIVNQEERAQVYADLVVLQNEKIAALDEEIEALKKLVRIEYRDGGGGQAPDDPGRGPETRPG